jgi:glutamate/tyrosine decarboxylase-like PLP-dependent enzyme
MRVDRLADRIVEDRAAGLEPFLVVATFGTTNGGAIDPLGRVAAVAREEGLWLHVDAAWGGAVALSPRSRGLLRGVEASDSLTLDCHKWLSVPMGAGLFLTRQKGVLEQTFSLATGYMPRDALGLDVADPYARSIQWSRRAIGLKVLLSLMVAGFEGYAAAVDAMMALGRALRTRLVDAGWTLVNRTPLPVVCFTGGDGAGRSPEWLDRVAALVVRSGRAWISTARLSNGVTALRACITNYRTTEADLDDLVDALRQARESVNSVAAI